MHKFIIICFFLISAPFIHSNAQTDNKDVTITASGSGNTLEEAKQSALRSAIEQAFGAFISSKTEILNDKIVADQMASVSSGNIKSYEMLNEAQLPDGRWGVTLKAIVSVDKLISFVQSKGITVEVKGGLFALNIKQQLLNEEGEINAVTEMVALLHEPMQISFDYVLKSGEPKSLDAESKNWEIPLSVSAICNKNIDFCANYLLKTLNAISLSENEVGTYKSLNKNVFQVTLNYLGNSSVFYLRKEMSINAIHSLTSNWNFYTRLFSVQPGMDEIFGNGEVKTNELSGVKYYYDDVKKLVTISFPTTGQVSAIFNWKDKKTLKQIEQISGYSVKPRGVVSIIRNGGYVVYEKKGHGLVVALFDIGTITKGEDAFRACDQLVLMGYDDWKLPSMGELKQIHEKFFMKILGDFRGANYWSKSGVYADDLSWNVMLFVDPATINSSLPHLYNSYYPLRVRPVRSF